MATETGSTTRDLEKNCHKGAGRERFKNMGSSSIGYGGRQIYLEAESQRPNSPLGKRINDDYRHFQKPSSAGRKETFSSIAPQIRITTALISTHLFFPYLGGKDFFVSPPSLSF